MQNKSFTYLLPLYCKCLKQENSELEENIFLAFLEQCYIHRKVEDKLENYFILKFNKPKERNEIFQKMLSNLKKCSIFVEQVLDEDYYYILLDIPKEIEETYNKFVKGQYSQITDKDKITILKFCKNYISTAFSTEINFIFSRSEYKRSELEEKLGMKIPKDLELSSIPDTLSETFKL